MTHEQKLAIERVLAFVNERTYAHGLDPDMITGYNDRWLTLSDLRLLLAAVGEGAA